MLPLLTDILFCRNCASSPARWNLHLSARLRERIKAMAADQGLQDSQMVEELLWLALSVAESR
jgi:hypothetical protein